MATVKMIRSNLKNTPNRMIYEYLVNVDGVINNSNNYKITSYSVLFEFDIF